MVGDVKVEIPVVRQHHDIRFSAIFDGVDDPTNVNRMRLGNIHIENIASLLVTIHQLPMHESLFFIAHFVRQVRAVVILKRTKNLLLHDHRFDQVQPIEFTHHLLHFCLRHVPVPLQQRQWDFHVVSENGEATKQLTGQLRQLAQRLFDDDAE